MLSTWMEKIMWNKKRCAATLMATMMISSSLTGCSAEKKDAIGFADDYLESVLGMDFDEMGDMLRDEGNLSDYEIEDRDTEILKAVLENTESEQTAFEHKKDEYTIEYVLTLPDFEELKGEEFEGTEKVIDFIEDLDKTEIDMEIVLIKKDNKWRVKDADAVTELYQDILDNIAKADIRMPFDREGISEVVRMYLPDLADAIDSGEPERFSDCNELDVTCGGVQIVISEYDDPDGARYMFDSLVTVWGCASSAGDNYCYLGANGQASGAFIKDSYLVQIYDCSGRNTDEVYGILDELQEMV